MNPDRSAADHWRAALRDSYGIDAALTPLDGEYDLNFVGRGPDGDVILKVMHAGCPRDHVEMQCAALAAARAADPGLPLPRILPARDGGEIAAVPDPDGAERLVWVQEALPGLAMGRAGPQFAPVLADLGRLTGRLDRALSGFDHPALDRESKWRLPDGGWIAAHLDCLTGGRRDLVAAIVEDFEALAPVLAALSTQAIHNDLNDYNILVRPALSGETAITGLIDFGDMTRAPRVCELAIAGAYAMLGQEAPERALAALVAGYHAANPLEAAEVDLIWPLARMRLAVSVVNSTLEAAARPHDPYVTISQAPAWGLLETPGLDTDLMRARLRAAGGLPVVDGAGAVMAWLDAERGRFAPVLAENLGDAPTGALSVAASATPRDPFDLGAREAARVGDDLGHGDATWLGFYGEPRLIYTAPAFRRGATRSADRRTVHLGIDVFAPAGRAVHAPLGGRVAAVENRTSHLDYGGMVILSHETPGGGAFHTLYGHLDPEVADRLRPGETIARGEAFARLGAPSGNGGWAPHLHFQLALGLGGLGADWPGVADPDDLTLWHALCPNPAALLNLPDARVAHTPIDEAALAEARRARFAGNLTLSYRRPLTPLRGWRHHLFDQWGRPYLDAYNNVPHVGHAHPRIVAVAADQWARLNTNTRYLHPAQTAFAEALAAKMPPGLDVVFLVNSGSEANELALRLARSHTGGQDIVTPDHGYHGNTTGAVAISAYKFRKPGGGGQRPWVHLVDVADDYRGQFRRDDPDRGERYAALVDGALDAIAARGGRLAGFIAETFPSVGGQIIPPLGYLPGVYRRIRAAGGLCIADEVQTGLGRLGAHYFGFEQQGAVPDMVVLGKPLGNGHPMGAVVTTRAVADSFARGPEFFSTFGGSTLSCRIGHEVLRIVDDEGLQENAKATGAQLLVGLRDLAARHPFVGDVRGIGLFVGVDLVTDRETRAPATEAAAFVINHLREARILIGREGPADNILKIRPPLTIGLDDIDLILSRLDRTLSTAEVAMGA